MTNVANDLPVTDKLWEGDDLTAEAQFDLMQIMHRELGAAVKRIRSEATDIAPDTVTGALVGTFVAHMIGLALSAQITPSQIRQLVEQMLQTAETPTGGVQ